MFPLAGEPVLAHDVRRLRVAETVDEVVVATSDLPRDDVVARCAERAGASVFRGSESDVLGRMRGAAAAHDADAVVRATGDDPLVSPALADALVRAVADGADYAGNTLERTFPQGLILEAVSMGSFDRVEAASTEPHQREHVTQYYLEHPDEFDLRNLAWSDVYDREPALGRDEVRLALDEPDDYELLRTVYEGVDPDERGIVPVLGAIEYVESEGLADLNREVEQTKPQGDE
jgi:spore coat polysaccharide biosynthesis protein SpsF